MKLSVGLITRNEEKDLPRTLDAIKDIADEIVIVDSGSTDQTEAIAKSYNVRFYTEEWKGFGAQKNSVIDKCSGQWILLIDADEEVTSKLKQSIQKIIAGETSYDVYKVKFRTICFGRLMRFGGWNGYYRIRLFKNGAGKYDLRQVHENFIHRQPAGHIKACILHYTYENLEEYFNKFNIYTSGMAQQYFQAGKKKSLPWIYFSTIWSFHRAYIVQGGFLDGYSGFLLATLSAFYTYIKYAKLRELNKKGNDVKISATYSPVSES